MNTSTYRTSTEISITVRTPDTDQPLPAIILCHGFCGIQQLLLPGFANSFTSAGFVTITFDYRGFGSSGGERGRLVPAMQIEDVLEVVNWTTTLPQVDRTRIGLWGTSLGAGHVLAAAAGSSIIKAVISQLGFADGEAVITGKMTSEDKSNFLAALERMQERKRNTGKEMFVSIGKILSDEESKQFIESYRNRFPEMDVKIPFLTVAEMLTYKPQEAAARVKCPVLVIVAALDGVNPPEQGMALFDALQASDKQLYIEAGARHYDMYEGQHFDRVIGLQIDWFNRYL